MRSAFDTEGPWCFALNQGSPGCWRGLLHVLARRRWFLSIVSSWPGHSSEPEMDSYMDVRSSRAR